MNRQAKERGNGGWRRSTHGGQAWDLILGKGVFDYEPDLRGSEPGFGSAGLYRPLVAPACDRRIVVPKKTIDKEPPLFCVARMRRLRGFEPKRKGTRKKWC